jgi:hypothetical protein
MNTEKVTLRETSFGYIEKHHESGTIIFYDQNQKIHGHKGQPAILTRDGIKIWFCHGSFVKKFIPPHLQEEFGRKEAA